MKIGFFTMPVHRLDKNYTEALQEDREAIILADRLGYSEAYVGEHVTDAAESITNSMLFQASLISDTKQIKLGTGTTNLSHTHPVLVAAQAAMMDHLLKGRFLFGISPGALESDAEALGIRGIDRNEMFAESIQHILDIWQGEPPYDLKGKHWNISTRETQFAEIGLGPIAKPYQKPHPPILGTVVAPFSKGVIEMGKKGFLPISANFLLAKWVKTHWDNYAKGVEEAGRMLDTGDWRVARSIFVHDDHKTAVDYGKANDRSPYRFYYNQLFTKLKKANRHEVFKPERDFPDEQLTLDYILDELVICGDVNSVVDQILAFRETTGDFGTLLYAGKDWEDKELGKRSMELMAEKVMPAVNAAIGQSAAAE
jgi:alkanesulfonate monooxygenase SsuD/methylene tetrahydromethanopterin reductase-like flavin-dependent oxidoreductase (luciferase family)